MLRRAAPWLIAAPSAGFNELARQTNPGLGKVHKLVIDRANGSYLWDDQDKKYLDFTCGIGVCNVGHCHPRIVKAVQSQTEKLWHAQVCHGFHTGMKTLIDKLTKDVFPKPLDNFLFATTGAEAVESAVRMSRAHTGRQGIVCLQGSFHGRSMGAAAMTSSKHAYTRNIRPLMPGVVFVPCPYTSQHRVHANTDVEELSARSFQQTVDMLQQSIHPSECAMLIMEPTLGEGGYVPLPTSYYRKIREFCTQHGIILVVDEIQSGYGRTGTMFNYEQFLPGGAATSQLDLLPDAVCFAKGIANGLPLSGLVAKKEFTERQIPGQQGGTYSGNALAVTAAIEVLDILKDEHILDNVAKRSAQLFDGLQAMIQKHNFPLMEVRGTGLMIGLQFLDQVPAGTSAVFAEECCDAGLLLLTTSLYESCRLIPSLAISEAETSEALAIIEGAMKRTVERQKIEAPLVKGIQPCCAKPCHEGVDQCCRRIVQH